ncbi:MAG: hypothetical protein ACK56I_15470, partial [bacterium]
EAAADGGLLGDQLLERGLGRGDAAAEIDRAGRGAAAGHVAEELLHLAGQAGLVVPVILVPLPGDLVVEDPAELHLQLRRAGVERDTLVAQERHSALHPAPALGGHLRGRGDVVG